MASLIKSELSKKSKWWIPKHRYFELKHFCLQYDDWKHELNTLNGYSGRSFSDIGGGVGQSIVEKLAPIDIYYTDRIELVERCCNETDASISRYLLMSVTKELTYDAIKAQFDIPCGREYFYDRYRKFFYILSQKKQFL